LAVVRCLVWPLLWDFKPLALPDPFHSLNVDSPSVTTEQSGDAAAPITIVFRSKADDISLQMRFVSGHSLRLTLCETLPVDDAACQMLGYTEHIAHVVNG